MMKILNTIKLLRFHFSIFLLPVSLFSLFYIQPTPNSSLFLVMAIWHLLVFPSSNGYNSYHDRDSGPIGGLAAPPKPSRLLLYVSGFMDVCAIALATFVNYPFAFFVFVYIFVSRLYSDRDIRLKKYPVLGFFVVFIFQGAWIFVGNIFALAPIQLMQDHSVQCSALASSFFVGTMYPLTQIYQHSADKNDNVKTLSMTLGIKGTFAFSGLMFSFATYFIYQAFKEKTTEGFLFFNLIMLPATLYFFYWAFRSFFNPIHVNFKNTMTMLTLSSLLNNFFFVFLLFQ